MQDFFNKQKEYEDGFSKVDNLLSRVDSFEDALQEKERKLDAAERKVADLTARLEFADKNRFRNKSQSTNKVKPDKLDRFDKSACDRDRDGQFGNI